MAFNPLAPRLRMHSEIPRYGIKLHYQMREKKKGEEYTAMSVVLTIKVTGYS